MDTWRFLDTPLVAMLRCLADLLVLNVLAVICSFPLITIGASFSAMYAVLFQRCRQDEVPIIKTFFRFFVKNFPKATALEGIALVIGILIFGDTWLAVNSAGFVRSAYVVLSTVTLLVELIVLIFGLTQNSIYQNSVAGYLKNSFLMAACAPWQFLVAAATWIVPWILFFAVPDFMEKLGAIYLMWGVSLPAWVTVKLLDGVYRKAEKKEPKQV